MKVAIFGCAPGMERAPFGDPSWEIWGLNDAYERLPEGAKAARWFELHGDNEFTRKRRLERHWTRLAELDIPVYTFHELPTVPKAEKFPIDQVVKIRDYFACTMSYQIAHAIVLGATDIALYGIPLVYAREVVVERPCVEWWLGYAEGRGINVTVDHDYDYGLLRQTCRYAFEDYPERLKTYQVCQSAKDTLGHWLMTEAERLDLTEPPEPIVSEDTTSAWSRLREKVGL